MLPENGIALNGLKKRILKTCRKLPNQKRNSMPKDKPKRGRPLNVETPEELWNLFIKYKTECKDNPRYSYEIAKNGDVIPKPLERPLTLEGFILFCYDIVGCVEQYFTNINGAYPQFLSICSRIKQEIRRDQIEGGMVGQYNPSITQRLNNIVERQPEQAGYTIPNITIKYESDTTAGKGREPETDK